MPIVKSKDGTTIAYTKTGNGQPIIVVDGALCSRAFGPTHHLIPLLSDQYTVVVYDRRGRNESGDTAPYSVDREVEDLDALISEVGGAAFVVGFSSGAALALHAAARGLNIKKLMLYEPPYVKNMGGHNPPADAEARFKQFVATGKRGEAVKFFMKDLVGLPAIFPVIMSLTPAWKKLKAVAHTLSYDAATMGDFSVPVQLAASVTVPTTVVAGEKTAVSLINAVKKLAASVPDAKALFLKGQSHNVSMKVLAPELIKYFKS